MIRSKIKLLLLSALVLLAACKKSSDDNVTVAPAPGGNTAPQPAYVKTTVSYKALAGIDPNLLSMDIYAYGQPTVSRPVVIYVHGGGWRIGDKTNQIENKLSLFHSLNYVFISVNYRLSPAPSQLNNPARIKFPDHNNDVADAVAYIFSNINSYGGNPDKMVILGHSAGAHLVSLTGTSQRFLPSRGYALNRLKGVASIDTEGYDVPSQTGEDIYDNAFGTVYDTLVASSPIFNITSSVSYPKFFVAKRGTAARIALANAFISTLQTAGVNVSQIDGSVYDHEGINDAIGASNETVITPPLTAFLQQCFQ